MPKTKILLLALTGVAVGLATSGCGGGDSALTKDEFVTQASEICKNAGQKLEAAGQEFFKEGDGPQPTEAQFVKEKVTPIFEQDLIDPIDDLSAPKGDESEIDGILNAGRQALQRLKGNPELLKAPTGSAKDPFLKFGQLASNYGLRCGGSS